MRDGAFSEDQVLRLAREAYRHGRARFDITPEKCALLVIDMQDEFVRPHWTPDWVPEATRQVPRIKELIEYCRETRIPVLFTVYAKTHSYLDRPKTGSSMPGRYPDVGVDRSAFYVEGRIWHELAPREDEVVIRKPSYGAFYDTPVETILRNLEKDTVIVCGTLTNYCCGMTARQAYERGFKVVFGSDVTSTDDPDMQEPELKVLRKGFARVMTAAEIIEALRGNRRHNSIS
jgi:nicotinamidase-related amidase